MSIETRDLETRYFNVDGAALMRIERVRGEFDAYDGFFATLNVTWWLVAPGHRRSITHAEIAKLLMGRCDIDPAGLANYFADANDLGDVISANHTSFIDFGKTFGRSHREMFPRIERGLLRFTTSVRYGEPVAFEFEFLDVTVELRTQQINKAVFWAGDHRGLVIVDRPNDERQIEP